MATKTDSQRYRRQEGIFPDVVRSGSMLAILGAENDPQTTRWLLAGTAAMGVPIVTCDYDPGTDEGFHWLMGGFTELVHTINPNDVTYQALDPDIPSLDLVGYAAGRSNPWIVALLNDHAHARAALTDLAKAGIIVPTLVVLSAPGGVMVDRCASPEQALTRIQHLDSRVIRAGTPEMGVLAGGLILNELMLGMNRPDDDLSLARTVGFYSLSRSRRVAEPWNGIGGLVDEIATNSAETSSFAARDVVLVGAGALGCWIAPLLAMEHPTRFRLVDGDTEVEASNLNRQILLVQHVGNGPKAEAVVRELRELDPSGRYDPYVTFIRKTGELDLQGADVVIAAPDNDEARGVAGDAAAGAGLVYVTSGSSPYGGQAVVCRPGGACYRCTTGTKDPKPSDQDTAENDESCLAAETDAVVASNMVGAALAVSELREAFAGRPTANVRFLGDGGRGNRLARMITSVPPCRHTTTRTSEA